MNSKKCISFLLVGGGWRAEFYLRIATRMPSRYKISAIYCENSELRSRYEQMGFDCFDNLQSALTYAAFSFVVVCVNRFATQDIIYQLSKKEYPILTETPIATSLENLQSFYQTFKGNTNIQVAEQYHLRPDQQARNRIIESGIIGNPQQATISLTNNYHAISLIKFFLKTHSFPESISAQRFVLKGLPGFGRNGISTDTTLHEYEETLAAITFKDKIGLYNFEQDQHRSFIRTQQIQIKGTSGVIDNNLVKYLNGNNESVISEIQRINTGENENMEGTGLKEILFEGKIIYKNPFPNIQLSDDEIAVAALLKEMYSFCNGGNSVYSLKDAAEDFYLTLKIEDAVKLKKLLFLNKQIWN